MLLVGKRQRSLAWKATDTNEAIEVMKRRIDTMNRDEVQYHLHYPPSHIVDDLLSPQTAQGKFPSDNRTGQQEL